MFRFMFNVLVRAWIRPRPPNPNNADQWTKSIILELFRGYLNIQENNKNFYNMVPKTEKRHWCQIYIFWKKSCMLTMLWICRRKKLPSMQNLSSLSHSLPHTQTLRQWISPLSLTLPLSVDVSSHSGCQLKKKSEHFLTIVVWKSSYGQSSIELIFSRFLFYCVFVCRGQKCSLSSVSSATSQCFCTVGQRFDHGCLFSVRRKNLQRLHL